MSTPSDNPVASPKKLVPALSQTPQARSTDAHAAVLRAEPQEVHATAAVSLSFGPSLGPATSSSLGPATSSSHGPATSSSLGSATLSSLDPATLSSLGPATLSSLGPADAEFLRMFAELVRKNAELQRMHAEDRAKLKEVEKKVAEVTMAKEEGEKKVAEVTMAKEAAKKEAAEARKAREEAEKNAIQELVVAGFPTPIEPSGATSAEASSSMFPGDRFWSDGLDVICLTTSDLANSFQPIDDLPKRKIAYGVTWSMFNSMRGYDSAGVYFTETDIASLVHAACRELCAAYQLSFDVERYQRIPRGKPDISLWRGSIPWVVVEVMKPRGAFEKLSWYQQMSNDLACLRLEFGVPAPIGILTTYEGWQFCWHKYATPVATARTIAEVQGFHCEVGQDDFNTLCVSPVYSAEDPNLRLLIASVFYKMLCLKPLTPSSHHMRYSREQFQTAFPGLDSAKVDVSKTAPFLTGESAKSDALYCVTTLGVGAEGETCLMADEDGACCAVKFYQFDTSDWDYDPTKSELDAMCVKACAEEHAAWVRAYGEDCGVRMAVLDKRDVLVMPLFQPITLDEWEEPGTMGIVMKHIKELSSRGVRHNDIEPRHMMWRDSIKRSVVLIDWGSATNIEWGRSFSEAEYRRYAKEQLQEGIVRMKERALAEAQKRKADEAAGAEKAVKALKAAKAAVQQAAEAVTAATEQTIPEQALGRTRSATKAAIRQVAAAQAKKIAAAKAVAGEAERAVQDLKAAIEAAVKARKRSERAAIKANAALAMARKAVHVVTVTEKAGAHQKAAKKAKDAAKAAAKAKHAAAAAVAILSSLCCVWTFDPVDEYETKWGCAPDTFDATKTRVIEIDPAKLLHLRAKHRLPQIAPMAD